MYRLFAYIVSNTVDYPLEVATRIKIHSERKEGDKPTDGDRSKHNCKCSYNFWQAN